MTPRAIGTATRTVVAVLAAAIFGASSFAGAAGAQAPAKPSPKPAKPLVLTITITGPGVSPPIVIRSTEDPSLYAEVDAQVAWMKSAIGNVMPSTPTQLGPDYRVTMTSGTTKTAVYDLYPLVAGGPRAHRAAVGAKKAAWFFAPVSMASGLEAAGVTFPTSSASGEVAPPTVATSAPSASLSKIMAQSKVALGLAAAAAVAVLVTLALAARRSRRLDRRRAMPAAIARLETVAGRARTSPGLGGAALATSGLGLRRAVPTARSEGFGTKVTGTARVPSAGQPTTAAPGSVFADRVTGSAAPVPPQSGTAPSSQGRSGSATIGPDTDGSATIGSAPGGSTPSASASGGSTPSGSASGGPTPSGSASGGPTPPGSRSSDTAYGTPRSDQPAPEPSPSGSGSPDRPRGDHRPPAPRASADRPIELPIDTPATIAVGTAHVVATAGTAASAAAAPVVESPPAANGTAEPISGDRAAAPMPGPAPAPAPRAPADDIAEPALGRPYVMQGDAGRRDSAPTAPEASNVDDTEAIDQEAESAENATDDRALPTDVAGADAKESGATTSTARPTETDELATEESEAGQVSATESVPDEMAEADDVAAAMSTPDVEVSSPDIDEPGTDGTLMPSISDKDDVDPTHTNGAQPDESAATNGSAPTTESARSAATTESGPTNGSAPTTESAGSAAITESAAATEPASANGSAAVNGSAASDGSPTAASRPAAVPSDAENDHDVAATGARSTKRPDERP